MTKPRPGPPESHGEVLGTPLALITMSRDKPENYQKELQSLYTFVCCLRKAPRRAALIAHFGKFVAYYRVSTDKQGQSGLGLDAQRQAVMTYLNGGPCKLIAEFTEV